MAPLLTVPQLRFGTPRDSSCAKWYSGRRQFKRALDTPQSKKRACPNQMPHSGPQKPPVRFDDFLVEAFSKKLRGSRSSQYVEAETGKGSDALDRRPQLAAALAAAKAAKCSVL